jgi:hypothetical protein
VLLQVVAFSRDISGDFHAIGQTNPGDLSESGVRLLRGRGRNFDTDASLERSRVEDRSVIEDIEAACQSHRL